MAYAQPGFVGNRKSSRTIAGCTIELTGYTNGADLEDWHAHEVDSISFLLSGTHEENLFGKTHQRLPGMIKYVPAGELHRCSKYTTGTRKINLGISKAIQDKMAISPSQIDRLLTESPQLKFTLLKLYHELDDQGNHAAASAQLLLYELFAQPAIIGNTQPAWVPQLRQQLNDEWDAKFDLDVLAANAGIHPVSLSRYFPKYFSVTLGTYIKQIKIDKALALIKSGKPTLTEIAYHCGFADQAHFTRTFKRVTGYLPKDFRTL